MGHPFKHFCTITHHRHLVIAYCFRAGIGFQGLFHDLSKYSPREFWAGSKFYQGTRSPTEAERETLGASAAWMHHKGRNRHHFEYWTDVNPKTKQYEPVRMPIRFVKEMLCDRIAASRTYQGKKYTDAFPLAYFLSGTARKRMHPDTANLLEGWLRMLAEKGEKETLKRIKKIPNHLSYGVYSVICTTEETGRTEEKKE